MKRTNPLISLQSVSKTYGADMLDFTALVLKNVHLDIMPGEFVIIFGPSGSGKSSLLNLMAGLEFPSAGRIIVRHRDLSHFNNEELAKYHRKNMGMVFQSFNLLKSLNVWENVALPQIASGVRYSTRKRRALRLLNLLNIKQYANRKPSEISGGEQQRVAIARALINNPYFLLIDEPTGNLDSKSASEVMSIVHGLNYHGKHTIVLVTHNPDYLHYASRILHMQDGQIVREERKEHPRETIPLAVEKKQFEELGEFKDVVTTDTEHHAEDQTKEVDSPPTTTKSLTVPPPLPKPEKTEVA